MEGSGSLPLGQRLRKVHYGQYGSTTFLAVKSLEVVFSECGQKPVSEKPVSQMDLDWRVGRLDLRALDLGRRLSS